ncbi:glycoside hydrolase family 16 protein [Phanerochaete carnosa HHB-10118-sp]|uniref:Glycoside hydrolase family 16 protein n=1 Tax=Phanerochaete carnosa (strain HHB-10118-sp) TaxID=650164 RepID=K5W9S3_PHACS|nr:glycoside hydrolase family 16 protein [Phanerochaete carnosa HHB-10118-sp]EKM60708.1 glycoside hydrolase family 16 protein [Phanerochaete carnosa HHB-10118-sp]
MYLHIPLVLFLASTGTVDASLLARSHDSLVRAATRAHKHAVKRSAVLARDLRLTFRDILAADSQQQPASIGNSRVYCVNSPAPGLTNSNGTNVNGNRPTGTASASSHGAFTGTATTTASAGSSTSSPAASSPWNLVQSYQGSSFFTGWDFFVGGDPTNGIVTYIDQPTSQSANLTSINSAGHAIMSVETTPQVTNTRQSIRITTQKTYTGGLVIMDSVHMPTGCGTWPAFWSNGPNWPAGGEIDIVEGVNDYTNNQATIHTNPGCSLTSGNSSVLGISGSVVGGTNCAAAQTGNQGCGVRASQTNSFGAAFNAINGGVYAMKWDDSGISVFFFSRSSIPSDITANAPLPDNWGTPMAFWPAAGCNPFTFFNTHSAIFDTTLCGDWASGVWGSTGVPGQDQSCAQLTGVSDCATYVRNNGAAFADAYWEVRYVQIYQSS